LIEILVDRRKYLATATSQAHQGSVDHYACQLGREAGPTFKFSKVAHGAEESVLKRIFCVLGRAECPKRDPIELGHVRREKAARFLPVTLHGQLKPLVWLTTCVAIFAELHAALL
jgi:hypothetical protein